MFTQTLTEQLLFDALQTQRNVEIIYLPKGEGSINIKQDTHTVEITTKDGSSVKTRAIKFDLAPN